MTFLRMKLGVKEPQEFHSFQHTKSGNKIKNYFLTCMNSLMSFKMRTFGVNLCTAYIFK